MSDTDPAVPAEQVVPAQTDPVPADAPMTDEEIATLASQGKLFRSITENTYARDQALERIAADAEARAEAVAARVQAAIDAVKGRGGP